MGILHKKLFTLKSGNLEFSPGLIPTLVTIVLLYLLVSLGQWQLNRAEYKSDLEAMIETRKSLPPIHFDAAPEDQDKRLYLPVTVTGTYDRKHHILLDNRVVNMRAGYDVYTPLKINNGSAILINRGWLPQGKSRQDLPEINAPDVNIRLTGLIAKPPLPGIILSRQENNILDWPAVVQYLDFAILEKSLGYSIKPMIIILNGNMGSAFHREPLKLNMKSEKHTGYAVQWFGLATVLLVIYFIVNTKRLKKPHD
jgi:surfeit locus 1 family protein